MTRMPATSSCMTLLISSSCFWSRGSSGPALYRQTAMHPASRGNAHRSINPNCRFNRNMQKMLPATSMVVRIIPRINWATKFCIWVMSLVTRVTSEPVPNRSIWGKEKHMIRRKQSFRISLPMFWLARWANMLFREPHIPPNSTRPTMVRPRVKIRSNPPAPAASSRSTPSSTIRRISPGCSRSMETSPTMNRAAGMAKYRYFLTYFHILFLPNP